MEPWPGAVPCGPSLRPPHYNRFFWGFSSSSSLSTYFASNLATCIENCCRRFNILLDWNFLFDWRRPCAVDAMLKAQLQHQTLLAVCILSGRTAFDCIQLVMDDVHVNLLLLPAFCSQCHTMGLRSVFLCIALGLPLLLWIISLDHSGVHPPPSPLPNFRPFSATNIFLFNLA